MTSGKISFSRHPRHVKRFVAIATVAALGVFSNLATTQSRAQKTAEKGSMSRKSNELQAGQQTFSSAEEATKTLVSALQNGDQPALLKILGPNAKDIISSGDDAEDKNNRAEFVRRYQQMHRLVMEPDGMTTLYIGAENWPTPIPLVHKASTWYFDTGAGKEEILYRRVGKNEMAAIQVCDELVDAQKEYYGQPHDGDKDAQYAQKFSSDPGKHNGLYWQTAAGEIASPIGPLVAAAAAADSSGPGAGQERQPFQGYYFEILKSEGKGAHSYIVNGKMTRGFAFVAYPAEYRSSGVMTFVVNQDGIVYEKDLGSKTTEIAKKLTRYDRDASWRKAD
jgi:cell division protein ZapA (FtsZ GTPase activity inhibitor)